MLILSDCLENYYSSIREENIILTSYNKKTGEKGFERMAESFLKQRQVTDKHLKQFYADIPM